VTILIDAANISATRSDRVLFAGLSVTVTDTDRIGVVGINGTGKSTLLRVLAGVLPPESGQVRKGKDTRITLLDQTDQLPEITVREYVGRGWESKAVLDRLDMTATIDTPLRDLSGGQVKRVALARALCSPCDLLILDEPTNHLDLTAVSWLENWLAKFKGGIILVSHDRHVLDRVTNRMLELDRGKFYLHRGGYGAYLAAGLEREEQVEGAETVRRNLARRELAWLQRGAKARSRKPQARIDAARRVIDSRREQLARTSALDLQFDMPRLARKVVECTDVGFQFDGQPPLFRGANIKLDPHERLGVVGQNGAGKTTFLEILAGLKAPSIGKIDYGQTVRIGYYAQKGIDFDPHARVRDVVAGPLRSPGDPIDVRLMNRFWFTGELPFATVGTLSGGERRRLQLLTVLASRPNVLLLDEPTNDLDLDTLRALEDFLDEWPGALVTISHDRTFLARATERLLVCQDGLISEVPGGLEGWIARSEGVTSSRETPQVSPVKNDPAREKPPRTPSPSTRRHELAKLDRTIERLTRERDRLTIAFQDATDHTVLAQLGSALAKCQAELESAEDQWLSLSTQ